MGPYRTPADPYRVVPRAGHPDTLPTERIQKECARRYAIGLYPTAARCGLDFWVELVTELGPRIKGGLLLSCPWIEMCCAGGIIRVSPCASLWPSDFAVETRQ